jgi:hypothetical protein
MPANLFTEQQLQFLLQTHLFTADQTFSSSRSLSSSSQTTPPSSTRTMASATTTTLASPTTAIPPPNLKISQTLQPQSEPRKKVGLLISGTPDLGDFKGLKSHMVAMNSTGTCEDVLKYLKTLFHLPEQCEISIEMKQGGAGRAIVASDFPVHLMEGRTLFLVEKSVEIIIKREGKGEEMKFQIPERNWLTMKFKDVLGMTKGEEWTKIAISKPNEEPFPIADTEELCADFNYFAFFLS